MPECRYLSHFRSVHRGAYFAELRTTTVRKLMPEAWGFLCPVHTPDGSPCGLLNHFSALCRLVTKRPDSLEDTEIAICMVSRLRLSTIFWCVMPDGLHAMCCTAAHTMGFWALQILALHKHVRLFCDIVYHGIPLPHKCHTMRICKQPSTGTPRLCQCMLPSPWHVMRWLGA